MTKANQHGIPWAALLFSFLASTVAATSQGRSTDDWKYFGIQEKDANWNFPVDFFFLANQIHRLPDGNLLVWTEALRVKAIYAHMNKDALGRTNQRLRRGYLPPYYVHNASQLRPQIDKRKLAEYVVAIASAEELADEAVVPAEVKMLVQLDCVNQRYQFMNAVGTMHGASVNTNTPFGWAYIAPDTMMSMLAELTCSAKK